MSKILSIVAIFLIVFWAIEFWAFQASSSIHVILVLSLFFILLRSSKRLRSFVTSVLLFLLYLLPSFFYFIVFLCNETAED
jgi:hypothetical protein